MGYRDEIDAANRQGKSREERWKLRAAVRQKYGMGAEKRERGGVAGAWDRNKEFIKPIAEIGVGALAGPWAGAALGAAMGGLDREGKSGIGFDAGQGLAEGVKGYGLGSVGDWGRGAIQRHLANRAVAAAPQAASAGASDLTANAGVRFSPQSPMERLAGAGQKALNFAQKNPNAIGGAFQGAAGIAQSRAATAASQQANAARVQELEFERQKWEEEQKEKTKRAQLAQQLYQMMMGQMSWNRPPGAPNG